MGTSKETTVHYAERPLQTTIASAAALAALAISAASCSTEQQGASFRDNSMHSGIRNEQQLLEAMNAGRLPNIAWGGAVVAPNLYPVYDSPFDSFPSRTIQTTPQTVICSKRPRLVRIKEQDWLGMIDGNTRTSSDQATSAERTSWIQIPNPPEPVGFRYLAFTSQPKKHQKTKKPDTPPILHLGADSSNNLRVIGEDIPSAEIATFDLVPYTSLPEHLRKEGLSETRSTPVTPSP